jgi:hypothetical protein
MHREDLGLLHRQGIEELAYRLGACAARELGIGAGCGALEVLDCEVILPDRGALAGGLAPSHVHRRQKSNPAREVQDCAFPAVSGQCLHEGEGALLSDIVHLRVLRTEHSAHDAEQVRCNRQQKGPDGTLVPARSRRRNVGEWIRLRRAFLPTRHEPEEAGGSLSRHGLPSK